MNEGTHKPKQPVEASSPTVWTNCSLVLLHLRTWLSSSPNWGHSLSVCTLTPTGLVLAQARTWRGPLGSLRDPGLSILSLLPLISCGGISGPRPWELGFGEQRVQP